MFGRENSNHDATKLQNWKILLPKGSEMKTNHPGTHSISRPALCHQNLKSARPECFSEVPKRAKKICGEIWNTSPALGENIKKAASSELARAYELQKTGATLV